MLTVWQGRRFSAVKLSVSPSREQLERIMAIIRAMPGLWQMVRWSASASPGPGHTRCRRPRSRSQCYNPLCSSLATYTTMINGLRTSLPTGITSYNRLWHNGQNGDKCGSLNATNQLQLLIHLRLRTEVSNLKVLAGQTKAYIFLVGSSNGCALNSMSS